MNPPDLFANSLLSWYKQRGRKDLPWRQNIHPYRVWISEIMLQQTQVKTVIPYFQRFLEYFPDIFALANAPEDEVLHLWTGLGYYSRARNLQRAAQQIVARFSGQLPPNLENLQSLPGIGRSTAAAILAIAYNQPAAILDGNVKRILARVGAISGPVNQTAVQKKLWSLAEHYTPQQRSGDYTQAIMDLGATVCTRTQPLCQDCPVQNHCQAYQQNAVRLFPSAVKRVKNPLRKIKMLIFYDPQRQAVLLEKRPPVGIWGGLWSLPECAMDEDLSAVALQRYGYRVASTKALSEFTHVFSHFQLKVSPVYIEQFSCDDRIMDSGDRVWYNLNQPVSVGLAAPVKRLLMQFIPPSPLVGEGAR